ncbi:proteasome subunit alpha [Nitrospira sp. Kam-Ns4a]
MYEEPYRWVEAVGNRRQYLDEQFKQGSPVVAISYAEGVLLLTVSRGTPKLYEIYDRIGLGGMGHPADLEKLRFSLLEMAHIEGFSRSPSDVTAARLMKYGLAPILKQAFEEIFKAPYIVKVLLAELGLKPGRDSFLTVNYDGGFEETTDMATLAATPAIQADMLAFLRQRLTPGQASLEQAVQAASRAWALGSLRQAAELEPVGDKDDRGVRDIARTPELPEEAALLTLLRASLAEKSLECAVLERRLAGSSKYRAVPAEELARLLPEALPAKA